MEQGAREMLAELGASNAYSINVTSVKDHDGSSPPYTFHKCIRLAIAQVLESQTEDWT
jgi:hypothetical protein